jgi:pimeloyl-ACP methyl ester carboxylesterase
MPKLGMSMQDGSVVEWPIAVGGRVEKGQTVVVIEHDKAEAEVEAMATGFVRHVYQPVDPDHRVPCGTLLAAITETLEEPFDPEAFRAEETVAEAPRAAVPSSTPSRVERPRDGLPRTSDGSGSPVAPAARALAKKLGIDIARVPGAGPGGRVRKEDVEAWAERSKGLIEIADGVALEVPEQGSGDEVVLLPGFGTDVSAFAPLISALSPHWRSRGVHPRGVGLSTATDDATYTVGMMASDAAKITNGQAHLIGASMGAAVALEMALTHPENVRSLVLITPFIEASSRLVAVLDAWCRVAAQASPEAVASMLLPWMFSARKLADEAFRGRAFRGMTQSASRIPATTLERSAAGLRAWSGTRGGDLAEIRVPCLVIAAGGDLLCQESDRIANAIPRAELVVVPGAGHGLGIEAADVVGEAVLRHLRG